MSKFKGVLDMARGVEETVPKVTRSGHPKGKRSDPEFQQVTAYIRKETHRQVKMGLLREGQEREFSELVEDLLSGWLQDQE